MMYTAQRTCVFDDKALHQASLIANGVTDYCRYRPSFPKLTESLPVSSKNDATSPMDDLDILPNYNIQGCRFSFSHLLHSKDNSHVPSFNTFSEENVWCKNESCTIISEQNDSAATLTAGNSYNHGVSNSHGFQSRDINSVQKDNNAIFCDNVGDLFENSSILNPYFNSSQQASRVSHDPFFHSKSNQSNPRLETCQCKFRLSRDHNREHAKPKNFVSSYKSITFSSHCENECVHRVQTHYRPLASKPVAYLLSNTPFHSQSPNTLISPTCNQFTSLSTTNSTNFNKCAFTDEKNTIDSVNLSFLPEFCQSSDTQSLDSISLCYSHQQSKLALKRPKPTSLTPFQGLTANFSVLTTANNEDSIGTNSLPQGNAKEMDITMNDAFSDKTAEQRRSRLLTAALTGSSKRIRKHVPHAMRSSAAVDKRNTRERRRIGGVNQAFEILRQHTPSLSHIERASKIRILRQAQAYIRELSAVLACGNSHS